MHLPTDVDPTRRAPAERRRLRRCAALAAGSAVLLAVLLALVKSGWAPLAGLDRHWVGGLHGYARQHTAWTAAMQTLTDLGGPVIMRGLLGLAALWLWAIGARVLAGWAAAQALVGWAAADALKAAVGRARPSFADPVAHAAGAAFPSGHATASAITAAALVVLVWPRATRAGRITAGTVAALAVLAVGWTRIALGVHWPTDVLAGWLTAGAVLGGVTVGIELWRPGALARDVQRVNWRTRPRVQRVVLSTTPVGPLTEAGPESDG